MAQKEPISCQMALFEIKYQIVEKDAYVKLDKDYNILKKKVEDL